jgi:hypothetical protein
MKKIYIAGDCHVTRLEQYHRDSDSKHDITFWGRSGQSMHSFDPIKFNENNTISSRPDNDGLLKNGPEPKKWRDIKDDGVIVLWLGYIDAKHHLFKYDNAEKVAKDYLAKVTNYFKSSKIVIMDPHPQFIDNLFIDSENIKIVEYQDRKNQNDYLCKALHEHAPVFGINQIITQDQVLNAIGLKEITKNESASYFPAPHDGLDQIYIESIYNLILDAITVD